MSDLKSFNKIFKEKIFRVPDYQRGYAWKEKQFGDFWEDLITLPHKGKYHYTGVLTLRKNSGEERPEEKWLIEDQEYAVYDVADGQQRLVTFILFIQAFIDYIKSIQDDSGKGLSEIFITDNLTLQMVSDDFLFKMSKNGSRTYKFGYAVDDPSDKYLKHKIFNEAGGGQITETFYTRNLSAAREYFYKKIAGRHAEKSKTGSEQALIDLSNIYMTLTQKFRLREQVMDEIDENIAFETMNFRGKELSCLELLKNRLIYLTTFYGPDQLGDHAEQGQRILRKLINSAWREVYRQLGRNPDKPLDDDDFLLNHYRLCFPYRKSTGFTDWLLNHHFSRANIRADSPQKKEPQDIRNYVENMKDSAQHWFTLHYPNKVGHITQTEKKALTRLNRLKMRYFRPLIMAVLKAREQTGPAGTLEILEKIERFIFIKFELCRAYANDREGEFYKLAYDFDEDGNNLELVKERLETELHDKCFDENGQLLNYFREHMEKKFRTDEDGGYYNWSGLKYFLYEYETNLFVENGGTIEQVSWSGEKKDIEHIYPQTPTEDWEEGYEQVIENDVAHYYTHSIGNLLISLTWKNRSLQNKPWVDKREAFHNGSQSEIKVSEEDQWGPEQIKERGLDLLSFMEKRWRFKFREGEKEKLLFPGMPTTSGPRGDG